MFQSFVNFVFWLIGITAICFWFCFNVTTVSYLRQEWERKYNTNTQQIIQMGESIEDNPLFVPLATLAFTLFFIVSAYSINSYKINYLFLIMSGLTLCYWTYETIAFYVKKQKILNNLYIVLIFLFHIALIIYSALKIFYII